MALAVSDVEVCAMGEKDIDTVWAAENDCPMSRGVAVLCVCVCVCVCARARTCACAYCVNLWYTPSIHVASFPGLPRFHLLFTIIHGSRRTKKNGESLR